MEINYDTIQKAVDDTQQELQEANEQVYEALITGDENQTHQALDQATSAYDGANGVFHYAMNVPISIDSIIGDEGIQTEELRDEIDEFFDLYEKAVEMYGEDVPTPRSFQNSGVEEAVDAVSEGEITVEEAVDRTLGT